MACCPLPATRAVRYETESPAKQGFGTVSEIRMNVTTPKMIHIVVTIAVAALSICSLVILIIAGFKRTGIRSLRVWSAIALAMMFIGAV